VVREGRSETEKLRGVIADLVREEAEALVHEASEAITEIVRSNLLPAVRSAIREEIAKQLEEAVYLSQTARAQDEGGAAAEAPDAEEASGNEERGLYVYGIADANVETELGQIGIEGKSVYTVSYGDLSAIVHDCPLEPYESDDEEVITRWVATHQHVIDVAEEKFGTIIPFGFDRIIKPKAQASAKDVFRSWLAEEYDTLVQKMEKIRGKKEYGVQIFYSPSVLSQKIADESEEIRGIKEMMGTKGPGAAYMYTQKLETALKREMESRMSAHFKDFYERIKNHVEEIKIEKTKRSDEKDRRMIMNLSCLVAPNAYQALGAELEAIGGESGFFVRFTGPWPAYSFV